MFDRLTISNNQLTRNLQTIGKYHEELYIFIAIVRIKLYIFEFFFCTMTMG